MCTLHIGHMCMDVHRSLKAMQFRARFQGRSSPLDTPFLMTNDTSRYSERWWGCVVVRSQSTGTDLAPWRPEQPPKPGVPRADAKPDRDDTALYLTEALSDLNNGAGFLDCLSLDEIKTVRRATTKRSYQPGETIFLQGDRHNGIFLIEAGQVRTYYAGPSGREITLAYWTPGHFVGGPEVFGGGLHIWSAVTAMLRRFQESGIILVERGTIIIRDPAALRAQA